MERGHRASLDLRLPKEDSSRERRKGKDGGECTSVSDLEDLHDQMCTGTSIWKRNYPLYGELEYMKATWTLKYSTTNTTHALTWVKHLPYCNTTVCSSKLLCLLLSWFKTLSASCFSRLTALHMLLAELHIFLTEISGRADSLKFITDW